MSERRMITTGAFMVDASIRWLSHNDGSIEVSYLVPGAFGHWQLCMAIKDPSVLLEALRRFEDKDEDVQYAGFDVYGEGGMICIMRKERAVCINAMDLQRLTAWLSELEA